LTKISDAYAILFVAQRTNKKETSMNKELEFEHLVALNDRSLQKIMREIDTQDLALALNAASDEVQEKIFRNMTERAIPLVKDFMETLSKTPLEECIASQERILAIWRRLDESNEMV
jgi:flagellar motor switch protein FliG